MISEGKKTEEKVPVCKLHSEISRGAGSFRKNSLAWGYMYEYFSGIKHCFCTKSRLASLEM